MIIWISLQCSESCGVGQKNRTVECVWKHTDESAGDACRSRKKPDAIKQCTMQPCTTMSPLPLSKGKLCQQKLQNSAVFYGYNFFDTTLFPYLCRKLRGLQRQFQILRPHSVLQDVPQGQIQKPLLFLMHKKGLK